MHGRHNKTLSALIGLTAIAFIAMVVFNGLGGAGYKGLFDQNVGQVSKKYSLYITPAGWAFGIWSFIYIYLAVTLSYCVSTVFRMNESGGPVYVNPVILSPLFYMALLFNFCLNSVWIFLWNYEYITASAIVLLFITYSGWASTGLAMARGERALAEDDSVANKNSLHYELRLQRVLVQNSLAVYATWTTIASLLNVNAAFQYFGPYDAETTSATLCALLLFIVIGWFILENTVFYAETRYVFTIYPVIIYAMGGILYKQTSNATSHPIPISVSVLTWTLLGVSMFLFFCRFIIIAYCHRFRRSSTLTRSTPENHGTFVIQ